MPALREARPDDLPTPELGAVVAVALGGISAMIRSLESGPGANMRAQAIGRHLLHRLGGMLGVFTVPEITRERRCRDLLQEAARYEGGDTLEWFSGWRERVKTELSA